MPDWTQATVAQRPPPRGVRRSHFSAPAGGRRSIDSLIQFPAEPPMPPLVLHAASAKKIADRLQLQLLDAERGQVYLGSTAPDIRVITGFDRRRTHFFDLDDFDEQNGVETFFRAYPCLGHSGAVSARTAAFVAGYLTHLVMDETWIKTIYRPYFGERSSLAGSLRANAMDRAVQFSMDGDRRRDRELLAHIVDAVARSDLDLEIGFIDSDTLCRWREVVIEMMGQPADWERFGRAARRHLPAGAEESREFEEALRSLPDLVDETLRYLTPARIEEFLADAEDRS